MLDSYYSSNNINNSYVGAVPPPEILYPVVKTLFELYGPLKCSRTGRPLFDNEAWKQSKNGLSSIHE